MAPHGPRWDMGCREETLGFQAGQCEPTGWHPLGHGGPTGTPLGRGPWWPCAVPALSPQLMQQQAALVAAHSAYLSPMATMAVQMQHMGTVNPNGLIATPLPPSSGRWHLEKWGHRGLGGHPGWGMWDTGHERFGTSRMGDAGGGDAGNGDIRVGSVLDGDPKDASLWDGDMVATRGWIHHQMGTAWCHCQGDDPAVPQEPARRRPWLPRQSPPSQPH